MTCGFIVVCVPCVPKILMESGVWRKIKKGLGMSVTAGGTPGNTLGKSSGSAGMSNNMRSANKSYLEIDDTELTTLGSESTEHLQNPRVRDAEAGIVRTTEVKITQNVDSENHRDMYKTQRQWR